MKHITVLFDTIRQSDFMYMYVVHIINKIGMKRVIIELNWTLS